MLVPCHCNRWKATNRIIETVPEKFIQSSVGILIINAYTKSLSTKDMPIRSYTQENSYRLYFKLFNILSTGNVLSISDCFAQPLLAWPIPNIKNAKCI